MSQYLTDYLELIEDINHLKKIDDNIINEIVGISLDLFKGLNEEELDKLCCNREKDKKFIKDNFERIYEMTSKN